MLQIEGFAAFGISASGGSWGRFFHFGNVARDFQNSLWPEGFGDGCHLVASHILGMCSPEVFSETVELEFHIPPGESGDGWGFQLRVSPSCFSVAGDTAFLIDGCSGVLLRGCGKGEENREEDAEHRATTLTGSTLLQKKKCLPTLLAGVSWSLSQ